MPFGTLDVGERAIPSFEPPYAEGVQSFNDVNLLQVRYRTTYQSICPLVPQGLELEDEPLMTVSLVEYRNGTLGSYNEYVHQVEVRFNDIAYDYNLLLVLDGEPAVLFGREKFGLPKALGQVSLSRVPMSRSLTGEVVCGSDGPMVRVTFDADEEAAVPMPQAPDPKSKQNMSMRLIASPILEAPPSLRELIPNTALLSGGSIQMGKGVVNFPSNVKYSSLHSIPIVRYEGAFYIEGCHFIIKPPDAIFPF